MYIYYCGLLQASDLLSYLLHFCLHFFSRLLCVQLQLLLGLVDILLHSLPVNGDVPGVISDLDMIKIILRSDLCHIRGSVQDQ